MEQYTIQKATSADLDELTELYGAVCDCLAEGPNYSGWTRQRYPTCVTAENWLALDMLHVLRTENGAIAATIALTHHPEEAYTQADWQVDAKEDEVIVIHTLAVHPSFAKRGFAMALVRYAIEFARAGGMKALRLDVCSYNTPAIALYEKAGFVCRCALDAFQLPPPYDEYRLYEYLL